MKRSFIRTKNDTEKYCNLNISFLMLLLFLQLLMISIIIIEQLLNWSKGGKKKIWGKADSKMEHFSVCGFSMVQTVELLRIYSSAR